MNLGLDDLNSSSDSADSFLYGPGQDPSPQSSVK